MHVEADVRWKAAVLKIFPHGRRAVLMYLSYQSIPRTMSEAKQGAEKGEGAGAARRGRRASPFVYLPSSFPSHLVFPPFLPLPPFPSKLDLNFPPNEHPLKSGRGSKVAALSGPVVRAAANNTARGICIGRMCGAAALLCPRRGRGEPTRPSFPRGVVGMVLFPANRLLGSRASRRDGGEGCEGIR